MCIEYSEGGVGRCDSWESGEGEVSGVSVTVERWMTCEGDVSIYSDTTFYRLG